MPRRDHLGSGRGHLRRPVQAGTFLDGERLTGLATFGFFAPHSGESAGGPSASVLRNLTDRTWTVVPDGEEPKRVTPNQRLGVRPMRIDFGPARGQVA